MKDRGVTAPPRVCLIVESGTEERLVDGRLSTFCDVTILTCSIEGGVEISQSPNVPVAVVLGGPSRARFGCFVRSAPRRKASSGDFSSCQREGALHA